MKIIFYIELNTELDSDDISTAEGQGPLYQGNDLIVMRKAAQKKKECLSLSFLDPTIPNGGATATNTRLCVRSTVSSASTVAR